MEHKNIVRTDAYDNDYDGQVQALEIENSENERVDAKRDWNAHANCQQARQTKIEALSMNTHVDQACYHGQAHELEVLLNKVLSSFLLVLPSKGNHLKQVRLKRH